MRPLTLDEAKTRGLARGQEYLGSTWVGMHALAPWRCLTCGHQREQAPRVVLLQTYGENSGCPRCRTTTNLAHEARRRAARVAALLEERGGGRCLDGLPASGATMVHWRCAQGNHPAFVASLDDLLLRGRWCPTCIAGRAGESYGEALCRTVLEQLFGRPFPRRRPAGVGEIDCFCPELALGIEHHGEQHYRYVPYFHDNPADFRQQQVSDARKLVAAAAHGITLVTVPAVPGRMKPAQIQAHVVGELRRLGCPHLPADAETRPVDLTRIFRPDPHGHFARLKAAADTVGLTVDEPAWMGASHRYGLHCRGCGDYFRRTAAAFFHRVARGERLGCRACSERLAHVPSRADWTRLVAVAADKNITILSTPGEIYARPDAPCVLRCERCVAAGHPGAGSTWQVSRRALLGGRYGCARCAGKARLTPGELRARVEGRGWTLVHLPAGEITSRTVVTVRCGREHTFPREVRTLTAGGCPGCHDESRGGNSTRRLTAARAAELAAQAGWVLGDPGAYRNTKTVLRYRCVCCDHEVTTTHAQVLHRRCLKCHPDDRQPPQRDGTDRNGGQPPATGAER